MVTGKKQAPDAPGNSESFADLAGEIDDLEPLEPGARKTPTIPKAPQQERAGASAAATTTSGLHFPDPDEPLLAWHSSIRQPTLKKLRRGSIRQQTRIDLHGETLDSARRRVFEELLAAARAGESCVLIVHGKGQHSIGGVARLREALPGWLCDPALENRVRAFAPAQPRDGGRGALYVLLG